MKGADQCPRCASRKWGDVQQDLTDFYAVALRVCANCGTAWEPFEASELLDADMPATSSFIHPCNNCAFRKGSPEQQDKEHFDDLRMKLAFGGRFYCHKGVPVTPGSEHGFDYPDGGANPRKLRLCRGYLNQLKFDEKRGLHVPAPEETGA
jgi:hypothetical protein